jgi:hypothetical protein
MTQPHPSVLSFVLLAAANGYAAMLQDAPPPTAEDFYGLLASEASQTSGSTGAPFSRSSK